MTEQIVKEQKGKKIFVRFHEFGSRSSDILFDESELDKILDVLREAIKNEQVKRSFLITLDGMPKEDYDALPEVE